MAKRLTKDQLRSMGVYNSWELCKRFSAKRLYISYKLGGRALAAKWSVISPDFDTDPDAHWSDYKRKAFVCSGRVQKAKALSEATAWAKTTYDADLTERDPFGGFQQVGTMQSAIMAYQTNPEMEAS